MIIYLYDLTFLIYLSVYFVIDTYASIETEQRNNFDIVEKVEMVSEGKSF